MEPIKTNVPAAQRVLPTHELNARRLRKQSVMPHVPGHPVPPSAEHKQPSAVTKPTNSAGRR